MDAQQLENGVLFDPADITDAQLLEPGFMAEPEAGAEPPDPPDPPAGGRVLVVT